MSTFGAPAGTGTRNLLIKSGFRLVAMSSSSRTGLEIPGNRVVFRWIGLSSTCRCVGFCVGLSCGSRAFPELHPCRSLIIFKFESLVSACGFASGLRHEQLTTEHSLAASRARVSSPGLVVVHPCRDARSAQPPTNGSSLASSTVQPVVVGGHVPGKSSVSIVDGDYCPTRGFHRCGVVIRDVI